MSDGGREEGDVELALFRQASPTARARALDPLSALAGHAYAPPDAPAPASVALPPFPSSRAAAAAAAAVAPSSPRAASEKLRATAPASEMTEAASPQQQLVTESSWREAMAKACADLLGKGMEELAAEFDVAGGRGSGPHAPRDLVDYVIMTTLRSQDSFAMQNAPSWLFNTMDRSGAGYVLREEFVRYAPFMSPVADAAVAPAVFDELVRAQVVAQAKRDERAARVEKDAPPPRHQRFQRARERTSSLSAGAVSTARHYAGGVRLRKKITALTHGVGVCEDGGCDAISSNISSLTTGMDGDDDDDGPAESNGSLSEALDDMYPISGALRFATWKQYFDAIQHRYHYKDDDWARVKSELGIDPSERLIKAQGGIDHSQALPTLGKLYLSQRYLIFFAAVGRNHYVARLGAVAEVGVRSLPILMRDCFTIQLESETVSAMNGISAMHSDEPSEVAGTLTLQRRGSGGGGEGSASKSGAGTRRKDRNALPHLVNGSGSTTGNGHSGGDGSDEASSGSAEITSILTEKDMVVSSGQVSDHGECDNAYDDSDNVNGPDSRQGNRNDSNGSRNDERTTQECNKDNGWGKEKPMPQHVAVDVMGQFTASGRPLVFSLIEFRDTSRRDLWVDVIRELVAAHRLHLQLGFGSSGRVVPDADISNDDNGDSETTNPGTSYLTYLASPFRNEPPPPLLVVAAHSNLVRYRSIRVVEGARNPVSLLVFTRAEKCKTAVNWYVDSVRANDNRGGRSWIERAMDAIRENMELNKRVYMAQDDEPFDVARLGEGIGRLAELCTPAVRLSQFVTHIVQWRNPPATILVLLGCLYFVYAQWIMYIPSLGLFFLAGLIVATRSPVFGLDSWLWGGGRPEDAKERQANVLELVAQVHDTLRATQNVIMRMNLALGKVQTLCLWGSGEVTQTWTIVIALCLTGSLLVLCDVRVVYTFFIWVVFSKHFLPPRNPIREFWTTVPAKVVQVSQNGRYGKSGKSSRSRDGRSGRRRRLRNRGD